MYFLERRHYLDTEELSNWIERFELLVQRDPEENKVIQTE